MLLRPPVCLCSVCFWPAAANATSHASLHCTLPAPWPHSTPLLCTSHPLTSASASTAVTSEPIQRYVLAVPLLCSPPATPPRHGRTMPPLPSLCASSSRLLQRQKPTAKTNPRLLAVYVSAASTSNSTIRQTGHNRPVVCVCACASARASAQDGRRSAVPLCGQAPARQFATARLRSAVSGAAQR